MDSILTYIKKYMPVEEDDTHFDQELIGHINSVLAILTQMGVGPVNGFTITGKSEIWSGFVSLGLLAEFAKTYAHLKVKMLFDPPTNSALKEAIITEISETEYRIQVQIDLNSATEVI